MGVSSVSGKSKVWIVLVLTLLVLSSFKLPVAASSEPGAISLQPDVHSDLGEFCGGLIITDDSPPSNASSTIESDHFTVYYDPAVVPKAYAQDVSNAAEHSWDTEVTIWGSASRWTIG
jgi:hypothetical protein